MAVTNLVLQERIGQQHTQVMLALARVEDKVTTLCKRMQNAEVASVKDRARIAALETQQETTKTEVAGVKTRTLRLIVAVALLSGASSAVASNILGALL